MHSLRFTAIFGSEDNVKATGFLGDEISAAVLVSKGMTADNDGLFPTWDETGDAGDDNGFTEDRTV